MRLRPALAGTIAVAVTVAGHGVALGLPGGRRVVGAGDNGDGYRLFCTVGLRPDTPESNAAWRGVVVTDFTTGHPPCGPVTSSAGVLLRVAVEGAGPVWTVTTLAWLLVALTAAGAGAAATALAGTGRWRSALVAIPIAPLVVVPWWSRFDVSTYAEPAGLLGTVWVVLGALVVAGTERSRRGARATALALLAVGGLAAATAKPGFIGVGVVAVLACAVVATGEHPRRSRVPGLVAAALVVALAAAPVAAALRAQAHDYGSVNATNLIFTALLPEAGPAVLGPLGLPAEAARSAGESYYWAGARDVTGWDAAVGADPAAARDRALGALAADPGVAVRMIGRGLTATLRPQLGYLPSTPRGAAPERDEVRSIYPETAPIGDLGRTWVDGVQAPWSPAVVVGLALAAGAVTLHPRLLRRRRLSPRVHLAVGVARTAALTSTAALGVVVLSVVGDGYYELTKHVWLASYLLAVTTALLVVAALGSTVHRAGGARSGVVRFGKSRDRPRPSR